MKRRMNDGRGAACDGGCAAFGLRLRRCIAIIGAPALPVAAGTDPSRPQAASFVMPQ